MANADEKAAVPYRKAGRKPGRTRFQLSHEAKPRLKSLVPAPSQPLPAINVVENSAPQLNVPSAAPEVLWDGCRVVGCTIINCNLRTHRNFDPSFLNSTVPSLVDHSQAQHQARTTHADHKNDVEAISLKLLEGGVDGLPALPLDDADRPDLRELFHHFFTFQYERIFRIVCPPPVTAREKQDHAEQKQRNLSAALTAPIFCLHFIAASHHQLVFRLDGQRPTKTTSLIRYWLTSLLREKLGGLENGTYEVNEFLGVILTLVMMETSAGNLAALGHHRQAVTYLVTKQGGLHNMGKWIPFVQVLDRLIAVYTNLPPSLDIRPKEVIRRPVQHPNIYGSFFEISNGTDTVQEKVNTYCFDACRTIELFEAESLPYDPRVEVETKSGDLHYLFFLKDCLGSSFAHLNAELAMGVGDATIQIQRCICLAARIVDYTVLQDCYLTQMPIHLANIAKSIMQDPKCQMQWKGQLDSLIWVLFVLVSMPVVWEGHDWAIHHLRNALSIKYDGNGLPVGWTATEMTNVRQYVWSDSYFNENFMKCCMELQSL